MERNYNRQMTSKSTKSKKSSKSSKSQKLEDKKEGEDQPKKEEEKEGDAKTDRDGSGQTTINSSSGEPIIKEKGWFTKQNVQNFIHFFLSEKKTWDKMQLVIGQDFVKLIENLDKPMKLNEMRNMKEPNYSKLRGILRNPAQYGD